MKQKFYFFLPLNIIFLLNIANIANKTLTNLALRANIHNIWVNKIFQFYNKIYNPDTPHSANGPFDFDADPDPGYALEKMDADPGSAL